MTSHVFTTIEVGGPSPAPPRLQLHLSVVEMIAGTVIFLWLVGFHLAGKCVGDEVSHVLTSDHSCPWFSARPACEISSQSSVIFTRKKQELDWNTLLTQGAIHLFGLAFGVSGVALAL